MKQFVTFYHDLTSGYHLVISLQTLTALILNIYYFNILLKADRLMNMTSIFEINKNI